METNLVAQEDEKEPEKPAGPELIEPSPVAHHNETTTNKAKQVGNVMQNGFQTLRAAASQSKLT